MLKDEILSRLHRIADDDRLTRALGEVGIAHTQLPAQVQVPPQLSEKEQVPTQLSRPTPSKLLEQVLEAFDDIHVEKISLLLSLNIFLPELYTSDN